MSDSMVLPYRVTTPQGLSFCLMNRLVALILLLLLAVPQSAHNGAVALSVLSATLDQGFSA